MMGMMRPAKMPRFSSYGGGGDRGGYRGGFRGGYNSPPRFGKF